LATPAERLTVTGMGLGTPGYMAPEQLAGDTDVDARADIYAVGVVAYEMLTGRPPFADLIGPRLLIAHMTEQPDPLTIRRPDAPARLALLVMRCLEKDPAERWQTVESFVPLLDELASGTPARGVRMAAATDSSPRSTRSSDATGTKRSTRSLPPTRCAPSPPSTSRRWRKPHGGWARARPAFERANARTSATSSGRITRALPPSPRPSLKTTSTSWHDPWRMDGCTVPNAIWK